MGLILSISAVYIGVVEFLSCVERVQRSIKFANEQKIDSFSSEKVTENEGESADVLVREKTDEGKDFVVSCYREGGESFEERSLTTASVKTVSEAGDQDVLRLPERGVNIEKECGHFSSHVEPGSVTEQHYSADTGLAIKPLHVDEEVDGEAGKPETKNGSEVEEKKVRTSKKIVKIQEKGRDESHFGILESTIESKNEFTKESSVAETGRASYDPLLTSADLQVSRARDDSASKTTAAKSQNIANVTKMTSSVATVGQQPLQTSSGFLQTEFCDETSSHKYIKPTIFNQVDEKVGKCTECMDDTKNLKKVCFSNISKDRKYAFESYANSSDGTIEPDGVNNFVNECKDAVFYLDSDHEPTRNFGTRNLHVSSKYSQNIDPHIFNYAAAEVDDICQRALDVVEKRLDVNGSCVLHDNAGDVIRIHGIIESNVLKPSHNSNAYIFNTASAAVDDICQRAVDVVEKQLQVNGSCTLNDSAGDVIRTDGVNELNFIDEVRELTDGRDLDVVKRLKDNVDACIYNSAVEVVQDVCQRALDTVRKQSQTSESSPMTPSFEKQRGYARKVSFLDDHETLGAISNDRTFGAETVKYDETAIIDGTGNKIEENSEKIKANNAVEPHISVSKDVSIDLGEDLDAELISILEKNNYNSGDSGFKKVEGSTVERCDLASYTLASSELLRSNNSSTGNVTECANPNKTIEINENKTMLAEIDLNALCLNKVCKNGVLDVPNNTDESIAGPNEFSAGADPGNDSTKGNDRSSNILVNDDEASSPQGFKVPQNGNSSSNSNLKSRDELCLKNSNPYSSVENAKDFKLKPSMNVSENRSNFCSGNDGESNKSVVQNAPLTYSTNDSHFDESKTLLRELPNNEKIDFSTQLSEPEELNKSFDEAPRVQSNAYSGNDFRPDDLMSNQLTAEMLQKSLGLQSNACPANDSRSIDSIFKRLTTEESQKLVAFSVNDSMHDDPASKQLTSEEPQKSIGLQSNAFPVNDSTSNDPVSKRETTEEPEKSNGCLSNGKSNDSELKIPLEEVLQNKSTSLYTDDIKSSACDSFKFLKNETELLNGTSNIKRTDAQMTPNDDVSKVTPNSTTKTESQPSLQPSVGNSGEYEQSSSPDDLRENQHNSLIFSGEYTKAMSKDWHSGHFCCWQCDESLTGQRYVLRDEHPYCIKCYESVFANPCEECNKIIGIDSKDLSYKDKHWHESCFLCNKCRVSLVDKQFGSKVEKIYCGNCYDAQFASRCDGCGEIFRAGTKKMEYKTRQWHEKCFSCVVCKTPIGTKSFIPREQEIFCATCYEEKFATRCVKCNKIITSGGVTYKNEPWHRECFVCTHCSTSLAGQRFTSRDDKPYCADCFGELFAKRCTACSKPITGIGGTRFISFEDRHWHNDCFICATCKTSLVGRGFITDAEDIICPECAKQKLMSARRFSYSYYY